MRFFSIILILFTVHFSYAQESGQLPDSVQSTLDSLNAVNVPTDTLTQKITDVTDSISNLGVNTDPIEALTEDTQSKIDSLTVLGLPTDKYQKKLDSLINKYPDKVKAKLADMKSKGTDKIDNLQNKVENKLKIGEAPDEIKDKLPNEGLSELTDKANIDQELPTDEIGVNVDGIDPLEEVGIENPLDDINNPVEDQVNEYTDKVDAITSTPTDKVNDLKEEVKIESVTENLDKVNDYGEQAGEYGETIEKAKQGDLTDAETKIEQEIVEQADLADFQNETAEFDKMRAELEEKMQTPEKYQDPDFVKQRILEKSKNVVDTDVLSRYKKEVAAARKQLKIDRLNIATIDSIKNINPNSLEGKPVRDRLLVGLGLEIIRAENTFFDIAPTVGYRLTTKAAIFGAYMYRVEIRNDKTIGKAEPTYGPRIGYHRYIIKGFYITGAYSLLRTSVPNATFSESNRKWMSNAFLGVGRESKIAKGIYADVHIMYNLLYKNDETPFLRPINLRMGFYLDLAKKPKKKDIFKNIPQKPSRKELRNKYKNF